MLEHENSVDRCKNYIVMVYWKREAILLAIIA
jgi:hypothetical protein